MIIGRIEEQKTFRDALTDGKSHFIAVYGRRRVGKTFLVRECYEGDFTFQHSGIYREKYRRQLFAFSSSLKEAGHALSRPISNWFDAFEELKDHIRSSSQAKKIIFLDELSWMDTPRSDLMSALESFWNGWASARKDIVLVICASATSWMISKVIHHRGGLYNRLTERIHLKPFALKECEALNAENGIVLTRMQILEAFLIFGGVPFYWCQLKKGESLVQAIDRLFFALDAPFREEYSHLLGSLFRNTEHYQDIIEALGRKRSGLTREEIIHEAKLANSGALSKMLEELELCGFLRKYNRFDAKSKGATYQLIDNFVLFYFEVASKNRGDEQFYSHQLNSPFLNAWKGLAFERVCQEHIAELKKALGISGVLTSAYSLCFKKDESKGFIGSQIDLAIVRRDGIINLCEMKYSEVPYRFEGGDEIAMKERIHDLAIATKSRYAIHPTLVTTCGAVDNEYAKSLQEAITMDALFL